MQNNLQTRILETSHVHAIKPDFSVLTILTAEQAQNAQTVIFDKDTEQHVLHILTTNNIPARVQEIQDFLAKKNYWCELYYTDQDSMQVAYQRYNDHAQQQAKNAQAQADLQNATWNSALSQITLLYKKKSDYQPADFVMEMVRLVFQAWASDLHFQPGEVSVNMRMRLDGVMQDVLSFDHQEFYPYLQKLKYICGVKMNVDYIPQDGRCSFEVDIAWEKKTIDVRASFMPWVWSESVVLRYLDGSHSIQSFENIGFRWQTEKKLWEALKHNFWMVIVTWPTWSGKTTTLYSILAKLNDGKRKIITLEDPIEYKVEWLQQSQINYAKDYDYAKWLKACLRHDPDIILVWETRDLETAEISINASLTWHLVFTTLHTNSALEAIARLMSMWVKNYVLAPSLVMIQAQRLMRRICPHCGGKKPASYAEAEEIKKYLWHIHDVDPMLQIPFDGQIPYAIGCEQCNNTWYKWRIAALETLAISEKMKEKIIEWESIWNLYAQARNEWFITLQEDAIIKLLRWITTLEEVRRVV